MDGWRVFAALRWRWSCFGTTVFGVVGWENGGMGGMDGLKSEARDLLERERNRCGNENEILCILFAVYCLSSL